jgi:DNA-binding phage protein
MDTNETVAETVSVTVNQSGKSKLSIAKHAGIPYTTFTRKLEGHGDFTIRELGLIAAAMGLTLKHVIPAEMLAA